MKQKKSHNVLSTKNLSIGYPEKEIASQISLTVNPSELTAVIGVNGSGKSTLLKTLTGDLPKISGGVFLRQKPLQSYSPKSISEHIGIVLSNSLFSKNLTAYEVVALGRQPYTNWLGILSEKDKSEIKKALREIEIENLADQKCGELSDGQVQKVFLARALAQDTDLIILDEPTNHLDLYHKAFVLKLLKKLSQNTKKAIVFASHELNLALQLCDKIILINNGKVVQETPKNLIANGHLQNLFPESLIEFDPVSESFKLK